MTKDYNQISHEELEKLHKRRVKFLTLNDAQQQQIELVRYSLKNSLEAAYRKVCKDSYVRNTTIEECHKHNKIYLDKKERYKDFCVMFGLYLNLD